MTTMTTMTRAATAATRERGVTAMYDTSDDTGLHAGYYGDPEPVDKETAMLLVLADFFFYWVISYRGLCLVAGVVTVFLALILFHGR